MLKGEKVYLRTLEIGDINILTNICNDKFVSQYNSYHSSKVDKQFLIKNFHIIKKIYNKALSIINEKKVVIGFINYEEVYTDIYSIGITIGRRFWGRGYGSDAILTLVEYLFDEEDAEEIQLEVAQPNTRAINCYRKCGFIDGNIIKKAFKTNLGAFDVIKMYLLKSEFYKENIV